LPGQDTNCLKNNADVTFLFSFWGHGIMYHILPAFSMGAQKLLVSYSI